MGTVNGGMKVGTDDMHVSGKSTIEAGIVVASKMEISADGVTVADTGLMVKANGAVSNAYVDADTSNLLLDGPGRIVSGTASINDLTVLAGGLAVTAGGLTVGANNAHITGGLEVSSTANWNNGATITSTGLSATGKMDINTGDGLAITGGITVNGGAYVTGTFAAAASAMNVVNTGVHVDGTIGITNSLTVGAGGVKVTGGLTVGASHMVVNGGLTASGSLTASNGVVVSHGDSGGRGVTVTGKATADTGLKVTGGMTIFTGDVAVAAGADFASGLKAYGHMTVANGATLSGGATFTAGANVVGGLLTQAGGGTIVQGGLLVKLGGLTIQNTPGLQVTGSISVGGDLTISNGRLEANHITVSAGGIAVAGQDLQVDGGCTVGGNFVQTVAGTTTDCADGATVDDKLKTDTLDVDSGTLSVAGGLSLNGNFLIHGGGGDTGLALGAGMTGVTDVTTANGLTVAGSVVASSLVGNAMTMGNTGLYAAGNSAAGNMNVGGSMYVTGGITVPDAFSVNHITFDSTDANGFELQVTGGLTVSGGNFNVDNGLFHFDSTGTITANGLTVTGGCGETYCFEAHKVAGLKELYVIGASRITGNLNFDDDFTSHYASNNIEFTTYNPTSDGRLKNKIRVLEPANALNAVKSIDPVLYRFKGVDLLNAVTGASEHRYESTTMRYGVIAQDVKIDLPELVHFSGLATRSQSSFSSTPHDTDSGHSEPSEGTEATIPSSTGAQDGGLTPMYAVRYTGLIPVVNQALKSLMYRIDNCSLIREEMNKNITETLNQLEHQSIYLKKIMIDLHQEHRQILTELQVSI